MGADGCANSRVAGGIAGVALQTPNQVIDSKHAWPQHVATFETGTAMNKAIDPALLHAAEAVGSIGASDRAATVHREFDAADERCCIAGQEQRCRRNVRRPR